MRPGRLTAGAVGASVLGLVVAVAPSGARVQRHEVTVVRAGGVRLVAWDSASALKGICFRLRSGSQTNARCDRSGKHKLRLAYTSFVTRSRSATVLGGVARRNEATVVARFADGQTLTLHTVPGKRYRGRQRGKVRFWAGKKADATALRSVVAKDTHGAVVEGVLIGPAPVPAPTPCPPCPGPPTRAAVACPVEPCPL